MKEIKRKQYFVCELQIGDIVALSKDSDKKYKVTHIEPDVVHIKNTDLDIVTFSHIFPKHMVVYK